MSRPGHLGVVVPAHNEADLIGGCIRAIAVASAVVDAQVDVHVVVVLDDCTDGTLAAIQTAAADIATTGESTGHRPSGARPARSGGARLVWSRSGGLPFAELSVVAVQARSVGAARRAGADFLLASWPPADLWLATTDADSVVPEHWFQRQLEHRAAGADAVVGTVAVSDWSGHPPSVPRLYTELYRPVDGHRHVHGANLSLSADTYLAVGGFSARTSDEDVILVDAVLAAGHRVTWAADLPVTTSARRVGRAPGGFAAHLAELGQFRTGGHTVWSVPRSPLDRTSAESVA